MATPLNSTKAAELIERQTGRRCSRQNLDKLCLRGALRGSACILREKPLQVDGDTLVAEYLSKVATHQAEAQQPAMKREAPTRTVRAVESDVPDYNEERARHEREKRMLAELDRRVKEGELVYRADFVTAQNAVAAQIMNRADALPRQIKQAIPHLLIEEVEKIERLIKEMMEGVANWSYEELEEDQ
jgi:phage terminase Nu1 subunit (DNA packaging protein)